MTHPTKENIMEEGLHPAEVKKALQAMHHGLLAMQQRLDDHEKVLEKLMLVMQNITDGQVPKGFRQPKK